MFRFFWTPLAWLLVTLKMFWKSENDGKWKVVSFVFCARMRNRAGKRWGGSLLWDKLGGRWRNGDRALPRRLLSVSPDLSSWRWKAKSFSTQFYQWCESRALGALLAPTGLVQPYFKLFLVIFCVFFCVCWNIPGFELGLIMEVAVSGLAINLSVRQQKGGK